MTYKRKSMDELPADNYEKRNLLARSMSFDFSRNVQDFLTDNAAFVTNQGIYHFGNSTIWYRTDIPQELEDKGKVNIGLDFTAMDISTIEKDIKKVLEYYPEFKIFASRPDPLFIKEKDYEAFGIKEMPLQN